MRDSGDMRVCARHLRNAALEDEGGVGAAGDGDEASTLRQQIKLRARRSN